MVDLEDTSIWWHLKRKAHGRGENWRAPRSGRVLVGRVGRGKMSRSQAVHCKGRRWKVACNSYSCIGIRRLPACQ